MKDWITPSPHDLYELGYRCATMEKTMRSYFMILSNSLNFFVIWIVLCKREYEGGIVSNRKSICCGETVIKFSTYRPSRAERWF